MVGWGDDRRTTGAADALDSGEGRGMAGATTTTPMGGPGDDDVEAVGRFRRAGRRKNDIDPRGDDYNDTTISLVMATAMRVAGDKKCDGSKSDGDDEKGCRQATATAPKRAVAAATRAVHYRTR